MDNSYGIIVPLQKKLKPSSGLPGGFTVYFDDFSLAVVHVMIILYICTNKKEMTHDDLD